MASYNSNQDAAAQKAEQTKQFGQQKAGEAQQATKVSADPLRTSNFVFFFVRLGSSSGSSSFCVFD